VLRALPPTGRRSAPGPVTGGDGRTLVDPPVERGWRLPSRRRGVRSFVARGGRLLALGGVLVAAGVGAPPAGALPIDVPLTGGASPVARASEPVVAADTYGAPAPRILRLTCRTGCAAAGAAAPGALVRVTGRRLRRVAQVVFLAGPGGADDTSVAPASTAARSVLARVPRMATSGPVALALADGTRSGASRDALVIDAAAPGATPAAIDVEVQDAKVFYDAERSARLSYVLGGGEPATVVVELVRPADDAVVARWTNEGVLPGIPQTIDWDGTAAGKVQRDGVYAFRARATTASGALLMSTTAAPARLASRRGPAARADGAAGADVGGAASEAGSFTFLRNRFPIVGAHTFGTGAAAFGGGRGHQGQDVFAECGTPIVAARGGEVSVKQYEGRAGHYVVIHGAGTDVDYVYMHLRDAALVDKGDRVRTGTLIGYVGDSGRADGCHLHFELWSGPGWYKGGAAFDPLGELEASDAQS
jgi:hypothetical protein